MNVRNGDQLTPSTSSLNIQFSKPPFTATSRLSSNLYTCKQSISFIRCMRSILQYNETRMGDGHSQYTNNPYTAAADSKHGIFQFNSFNFNSVHNSTGLYINWNSHSKTISMRVCMCTPAYMH